MVLLTLNKQANFIYLVNGKTVREAPPSTSKYKTETRLCFLQHQPSALQVYGRQRQHQTPRNLRQHLFRRHFLRWKLKPRQRHGGLTLDFIHFLKSRNKQQRFLYNSILEYARNVDVIIVEPPYNA